MKEEKVSTPPDGDIQLPSNRWRGGAPHGATGWNITRRPNAPVRTSAGVMESNNKNQNAVLGIHDLIFEFLISEIKSF